MIIELAEDDAPKYEQQKPKKNLKSASPISQEATSLRTDSSTAEGKDPTVQPSSRGAQPQSEESFKETPTQGAEPTGHPDETLMKTRTGSFFLNPFFVTLKFHSAAHGRQTKIQKHS